MDLHRKPGGRNHTRRAQAGFSLIELLIVVAVILTLASIAVPNYLSARMAANEASAVQSVRTITSAETAYAATFSNIGYSANLSDLSEGSSTPCTLAPTQACLIDTVLASGTKSGYLFTYVQDTTNTPSSGYKVNGDPLKRGSSGSRSFYTDQPGVIRYNSTKPAGPNDPVV